MTIIILFSIVYSPFNATNSKAHASSSVKFVFSQITEAYYDDLDSDGMADDVRLSLLVSFYGFSDLDYAYGIDYNVLVGLILPDGSEFWYLIYDVAKTQQFNIGLDMLNHATAAGWYEALTIGYWNTYEQPLFLHDVIFDPPGGQSGDDPRLILSKY